MGLAWALRASCRGYSCRFAVAVAVTSLSIQASGIGATVRIVSRAAAGCPGSSGTPPPPKAKPAPRRLTGRHAYPYKGSQMRTGSRRTPWWPSTGSEPPRRSVASSTAGSGTGALGPHQVLVGSRRSSAAAGCRDSGRIFRHVKYRGDCPLACS